MPRPRSSFPVFAVARVPLAAVAGLAATLAGCVFGRHGLQPEKNGRAVYLEACASCHGVDGTGDGPVASALRTRPADLTTLAARHGGTFPRGYVLEIITGKREIPSHGSREMPIWNQRFSPSDTGGAAVASIYAQRHLERILDYLQSVQKASRRE